MNRRAFFRNMVGGVAATAAVRTWPFRVFSFPKEVLPYISEDIARYLQEATNSLSRDIDLNFYRNGFALYMNNPLMQTRLYNVTVPLPDDVKELLIPHVSA